MAEYILKLDIDESELGRKLKRVLGGLNVGGGGQVSMMGGGSNVTPAQTQKLFEAGLKKLTLGNEKLQKALDKQGIIQKKGFTGAFGPQLFKLAGIAMGVGAIVQLGKGLIDASPLLQAMHKIFSTALTLFLRPFGDFIAFLLRPFVMLMLKYAIQFYRTFGGKQAQADVEKTKEALGLGEEGTFEEQTSAWLANLTGSWEKGWKPFFEWLAEQQGGAIGGPFKIHACPGPGVSPEQQAENVAKALGDIYPWLKQRPTVDGKPVSGPMMECGEFFCKPGGSIFEQWNEFLKGTVDAELSESDANMLDMSAKFGKIAEYAELARSEGAEPTAKTFKNIARLYVDARQDGVTARKAIESIANQLGMAEQRVLQLLNRLSKQKTSSGKKTTAAKEAKEILEEEEGEGIVKTEPTPEQPEPEPEKPPRVSQEEKDKAAIDTIISYNKAFGWDVTKPRPSPYEKIYPSIVADYKSRYPNYRINEYATGGIITEPVLGIGQRTGQRYSFGEGGPEQVTPLGGCTGGPINVTFNVSGVFNTRDFESSVKPMVLRWFKEVKSKRGII